MVLNHWFSDILYKGQLRVSNSIQLKDTELLTTNSSLNYNQAHKNNDVFRDGTGIELPFMSLGSDMASTLISTTPQCKHQVKYRTTLNVVLFSCFVISKLFTCIYESAATCNSCKILMLPIE